MTNPEDSSAFPLRVRRLAKIAEFIAILGMIGAGGATLYLGGLALTDSARMDHILQRELLEDGGAATITPLIRGLAYLLAVTPILVGMFMLNCARRLFGGYRRGDIFTPRAASRLGMVGWAVFALAPVSIFTRAAAILTLTVLNAPGERQIGLVLHETDLFAVVVGLLLVVVGRILHEAARISDENKSFV